MKKLRYYILTILISSAAFTSCQKVIDIDVNTSPSQMVIEGNITDNRETQYIKLSRSVAYTENNTYPAVQGAEVRVTDNIGNTWRFTETQPGVYSFDNVRGVAGRTYTLNVIADGQTYTATSVMPRRVSLDSLHLQNMTFGNETRKIVVAYYNDPPNVANQYRYVLQINGVLSKTIYTDDDRLTDGNEIRENLYPQSDDDDEEDLIKNGDEVKVEMQCIDKPVFNYWFSLRQQYRGGPGGGTTPGNPPSNISNNALGYFSAHTSQTKIIYSKE